MHPYLTAALVFALPLVAEEGPRLPVIPGASGFGMDTPAGRKGKVLKVTTLEASGEGSLRAALEADGPRVVVFEVAGVIDLGRTNLTVAAPFVTIAGQTAPPPGITIIKGALLIGTHDVLVQHIRVRPGDAGQPKKSGWSPDGISTSNVSGQPGSHHVVVDHCSCTWGIDENLTASGQRHEGREGTAHQMSFSNCIIAECLDDSSHEKGRHSMGTLIHDHARDISIIGNLYACNVNRNPVLKPDAGAVVVNNLIFNPGKGAIHSYWTPQEYAGHEDTLKPCVLAAVGNVCWHGADTVRGLPLISIAAGKGEVFAEGNVGLDTEGKPLSEIGGNPKVLKAAPFWPAGLRAIPSRAVPEAVLKNAGAFPAQRDEIDRRIVEQVRTRKARVINSQEQVGGYPKIEAVRRLLEVPAKPDADDDGDGYTNLEEWLHAFAATAEGATDKR